MDLHVNRLHHLLHERHTGNLGNLGWGTARETKVETLPALVEAMSLMSQTWRCPKCYAPLGRLAANGELVIAWGAVTDKHNPAMLVERSREGVVIYCHCGGSKAFTGKQITVRTMTGRELAANER